MDPFDFRVMPQQQGEKDFAQKAGRAGDQDPPMAKDLFKRRHRV